MGFLIGLILGIILGIILIIIGFFIFKYYMGKKNLKLISELLKQGKFLKPLDRRDVDEELWKDLVNFEESDKDLKDLNKKIFKIDNEQN